MYLTLSFIKYFALGLFYAAPLLMFLMLLVILFGQWVGRHEGWSWTDALYYSMITATTVGYGDFRPKCTASKMLAILIAFSGLLFTGLVVAIGVQAASVAFKSIYTSAAL